MQEEDRKTSRVRKAAETKAGRKRDSMKALELGDLHYYRCEHCLEVFTVSEKFKAHKERREVADGRDGHWWMTAGKCVCLGRIQWMGQVTVDSSKADREVERPVCDARCTRARGPECYCFCGCKYHGSEMTVFVVQAVGGMWRPEFSESTRAAVIARGNNYTALLDAVTELIRKSTRLDDLYEKNWEEYKKAKRLLVYRSRMEILQGLYGRMTGDGQDFVLPFSVDEPRPPATEPIYFPKVADSTGGELGSRKRGLAYRANGRSVEAGTDKTVAPAEDPKAVFNRLLSTTTKKESSPSNNAVTPESAKRVAAIERMLNAWLAATV